MAVTEPVGAFAAQRGGRWGVLLIEARGVEVAFFPWAEARALVREMATACDVIEAKHPSQVPV